MREGIATVFYYNLDVNLPPLSLPYTMFHLLWAVLPLSINNYLDIRFQILLVIDPRGRV